MEYIVTLSEGERKPGFEIPENAKFRIAYGVGLYTEANLDDELDDELYGYRCVAYTDNRKNIWVSDNTDDSVVIHMVKGNFDDVKELIVKEIEHFDCTVLFK